MTIKQLQKICHEIAIQKGFWDCKVQFSKNQNQICNLGYACDACPYDRNDAEMLMLMVSELGEACEDLRQGNHKHVGEELADCVIRIMDYCEARGIDLQKEIVRKIKINKRRPYKHGKAF